MKILLVIWNSIQVNYKLMFERISNLIALQINKLMNSIFYL